MNYTPIRSKNTSLTLFAIIFTACLTTPLTVTADTSASVDAIMEQLKSFKAPVPKVSTPTTIVVEETVKSTPPVEKQVEPVKIEAPAVVETKNDPTPTGIYVAPETQRAVVRQRAPRAKKKTRVRARSKVATKKRSVRKTKRRVNKRKNSAVDNQGFDQEYMSLINDILNDRIPPRRSQPVAIAPRGSFSGPSGWIFVGKYRAGYSQGIKTLKSGNQLPKVGQQYTVKSPLLNMRKTKPLKSGLGKLIKVLRIGDQVRIKSIHRSSKNNYWANIVRP